MTIHFIFTWIIFRRKIKFILIWKNGSSGQKMHSKSCSFWSAKICFYFYFILDPSGGLSRWHFHHQSHTASMEKHWRLNYSGHNAFVLVTKFHMSLRLQSGYMWFRYHFWKCLINRNLRGYDCCFPAASLRETAWPQRANHMSALVLWHKTHWNKGSTNGNASRSTLCTTTPHRLPHLWSFFPHIFQSLTSPAVPHLFCCHPQ